MTQSIPTSVQCLQLTMSETCNAMSANIYDPITGVNVDVVDIRAEIATITDENPVPAYVLQAFLRDRRMIDSSTGFLNGLFGKFISLMASLLGTVRPPPSVAVGVFFRPSILGFTQNTAIYWNVLAPEYLGGSSTQLVFLTSSNQA